MSVYLKKCTCPQCGKVRQIKVHNKTSPDEKLCFTCANKKTRQWDEDPWMTGRLPDAVTRNSLWT